jgi:hypothetical protein
LAQWRSLQGLGAARFDGARAAQARRVDAACTEALSHGVHSADVILNSLARRLVADCARYDTLRRSP